MKKRRKWPYVLGIIVLLVPVLLLYNAFNGNPISKFASKVSLDKYLKETYPDDEFRIWDGFYNFKYGAYTYEVSIIGDETQEKYELNVGGLLSNEVINDEIYYENLDIHLMERLEKEANKKLKYLLEQSVDGITDLAVRLNISQGKYDDPVIWDKNFQPDEPMYIDIVLAGETLAQSDVYQQVVTIQRVLNNEGYDYSRVSINAKALNGDEWMLKYVIGFGKEEEIKEGDIELTNKQFWK